MECAAAADGDPCAVPGDQCRGLLEEHCKYFSKWCDDDHLWSVEEFYEGCCYEECCYQGCCEPYSCPSEMPEPDAPCSSCWESQACWYEIETECGPVLGNASCQWETQSWRVEVSRCDEVGSGGMGAAGGSP